MEKRFYRRRQKKGLRIILAVLTILALLLLACYVNHRVRMSAESKLLAEAAAVKDSARTVAAGGIPQVPMLLFISDGSGGTGFPEDVWRGFQLDYLAGVEDGVSVELDCPHYVHDHAYERIHAEIRDFIQSLPQ